MIQLSLWDETPAQDAIVSGVPEILFLSHSWADGDTRPDQLERLSHVILGDISMFDRSDGKPKEVYRIVTTGIVDGQVIAAYEYVCNSKEFYGGSSESPNSEIDEDDDLEDF
jgi:hypothetical protein